MPKTIQERGLFQSAAAAAMVALSFSPIATFDAAAAGPAMASNDRTVSVRTGDVRHISPIEIHKGIPYDATAKNEVYVVCYCSNDADYDRVLAGVKRTMDTDGKPVVAAVLRAVGDGYTGVYGPNELFRGFNQGGGEPMLKWTTSQHIIDVYNAARPDQVASTPGRSLTN